MQEANSVSDVKQSQRNVDLWISNVHVQRAGEKLANLRDHTQATAYIEPGQLQRWHFIIAKLGKRRTDTK